MSRNRGGRRGKALLEHHLYVLFSSLGLLARRPLTAMMTILVIAIALALPTGLYLLLKNTQSLSASWQAVSEITVFLADTSSEAETERLAETVRARDDVDSVRLLSPEQALEDFRTYSDMGDVLHTLEDNPLPFLLIVQPVSELSPQQVDELVGYLAGQESVRFAQFDMDWLLRFQALVDLCKRFAEVLAVLLALAVVMIVGNTIRLDIQNRREEIEVHKMLGATDAFIRRPFLYTGVWFGIFGGATAALLVLVSFTLLKDPVIVLMSSYGSGFIPRALDIREAAIMAGISVTVGWLGSFTAVARHLSEIRPR